MNTVKQTVLLFLLLIFSISAYAAPYDAKIQFTQRIVLSVPVSGEIAQVNINRGDQFKSGDVLLALNKVPFEASVQKAQAQVNSTQALLREADRDHQHLLELYDRGVLSKVELENAELKLKRATADFNAAQAKLTQANYDLQHSMITAPFDGLVLDVKVRPYESVNNLTSVMPLMTIAQLDKYTATALVPLSVANKLKLNSKASVSVSNKNYTGSVSGIAYEPVDSSKKDKLYEVRVDFDSKGKLLRAGQSASVSLN